MKPWYSAGLQRGHDQRVDLADPGLDGQLHAVVEMARRRAGVGLAVVAAQGDVVGAVGQHGGDEVAQVLAGRSLADEDPHPLAPLLLGLVQLGALVVRFHAGGQVGVEGAAQDARRVTVDPTTASGGGDAGQHLGVAGDDAGEVHDLGHADGGVLVEQGGHVRCEQLGARALERGGRHAAAGTHAEGERAVGGPPR